MQKLFESWRRFVEKETKDLPQGPPVGQEQLKIKPKKIKKFRYRGNQFGYVLGTVEGEIIATHNPTKTFYGASNNKPLLALANLILCKQDPRGSKSCLSDKELGALLNYKRTGDIESNNVNKALSKKSASKKTYVGRRKEELASFEGMDQKEMNQKAAKFLEKLGLRPELLPGIRYGMANNRQTPLGYYHFLRLLINPSEFPGMQGHEKEAEIILSWMRRDYGVHDRDREFLGRFKKHQEYLNKKGIDIGSIYGKGGYVGTIGDTPIHDAANNSAIVIDNKYILIVFTNAIFNRYKSSAIKALHDMIYQILSNSGVY